MSSELFNGRNPHGLILYDFEPSPCARRVRITLLEKGLAWDTQRIDLSRLEQRDPEYLELNPNGFVPTLAHGERVIYESNVITEYLDDAFPEVPLYPADAAELAAVKMWQSAEATMAKEHRPLMYQRVMGPLLRLTRSLDEALALARRSTSSAADLAWEKRVWSLEVLTPREQRDREERLLAWLDRVERALEGREYLVGDRFTQAEISVYPRVAMLPFVRVPIGPMRYPNVRAWMRRLAHRPSFERTRSKMDRGLARLSRTPFFPWLQRVLRTAPDDRSLLDAALLVVLAKTFRRVLRVDAELAATAPRRRRPIRKPRPGSIPPRVASAKASRPLAPEDRERPITLYDYEPSPSARRIRMVLAEKGLSWSRVDVDMSRMAHKAPAFLAVNPNGELPALRHGDRVLHDSGIIAEYLDRLAPNRDGRRLYPDDAFARARVRMWLALEAGTHKELRPLFYLHVVRRLARAAGMTPENVDRFVAEGVEASQVEWLRDAIAGRPRFDTSPELARSIVLDKVDVLERCLARHEFLVGDACTMADIGWFTCVDSLGALGISLDHGRHPNVCRWHRSLGTRPSANVGPAIDLVG